MRIYNDPTMEIKLFEAENIVTEASGGTVPTEPHSGDPYLIDTVKFEDLQLW